MAFICPICQKSFSSKRTKDAHVALIHEKSGRFECKYCDKKFDRKSNLKRHERIHTGEKPFACEVCQMRFNDKFNLNRHLGIHAGEKPFACKLCKMRFKRKYLLKNHLGFHAVKMCPSSASHHPLKGEQFQCDDCPQVFPCKRYLGIHRVACHLEKKFVCKTCGRICATRQSLQIHLRVHSEDRPFRCDHCEFSSKYKQHLKKHQAQCHSTTRPETSGGRLARGDDREELPVADEQPVASDLSGGANYNLRVRRKTPNSIDQNDVEAENTGSNSRGNSENGGGRQDSDREPTEPDEESGLEDELVVLDNEDEQNGDEDCSDEPLEILESSESRASREYDVISLSSDDEDGDLTPELSTVTSANLRVVYGVEYRVPDESD